MAMRRRDVLAGLAAAGVVGGGAVIARRNALWGANGPAIRRQEVETIDAPGSDPGTVQIPDPDRPTVVKFFATWCTVCQSMMEPTGEVYDRLGGDIGFLSLTNEPVGDTVSRADVAAWWDEHDGRWTVGLDRGLKLTEALDASEVPYTFVIDSEGIVQWADSGYKSADELSAAITAAVEG